jgi:hypothetical protein
MKILIYGSNGWIGNQFIQLTKLNEIEYYCGFSRCDNYSDLLDFKFLITDLRRD